MIRCVRADGPCVAFEAIGYVELNADLYNKHDHRATRIYLHISTQLCEQRTR